ncbi:MAG: hypothetical protein CBD74_15265 [Saprospirales bacterium TMED214]|nr:MAG: hypothetical protein CBD74_15265 [Saprospirales bacterium TMED214]|tara:strand:- start:291 stop:494 length:204 start_codon:yes stop_codon:yes gene_type:complete
MTDPELFSHLMAEITARFEELAGEAANLQDPPNATVARLGRFCTAANQVSHLAQSARFLLTEQAAGS